MSDYNNPYQSPETQIIPEKMSSSGMSLSETMLRYLKEASPWLQFVGIMGIIGSALIVFGGIIGAIVLFAASNLVTQSIDQSIEQPFPAWIMSMLPLAYIPGGALIFFPSFFTFKFGAKIRTYLINNLDEDLEQAFKNNKSLWKFNGIMYIISLAFIPISFIAAIIIGMASVIPGL